jgi:hypothetical protein
MIESSEQIGTISWKTETPKSLQFLTINDRNDFQLSYLPFSRVVFHKRRYLVLNMYYIGQKLLFIFSLKIKQPYDPIITLTCVIKI